MLDLPPVRFSNLKTIGRSPLHYKARVERVDETSPETERAMRFGTLAHKLVLGKGQDVAVYEGKVRNGKVWDAFEAENVDKLIVTRSEMDRGEKLAAVVHADPIAVPRLVGLVEHELAPWPWLGRMCGGRPDVVGAGFIADVKTAPFCAPEWMARHALKLAYHAQLRWYQIGAEAETGRTFMHAYLVCVETRAPFAVTTMVLTQRALEQGEKLCRIWMERLLSCEGADDWPGYAQFEVPLDVPEEDAELVGFDDEEIAEAA